MALSLIHGHTVFYYFLQEHHLLLLLIILPKPRGQFKCKITEYIYDKIHKNQELQNNDGIHTLIAVFNVSVPFQL